MASDILVKGRGLKFSFGSRVIFDDVDLDIRRHKITTIMGPSGTGKTTLLRMIGGQVTPDSGTLVVDGCDLGSIRHGDLYSLRKKMGMLFQGGALFTSMSVYDNVAFPLREHTNLPEEMVRDLVLMKLEAVGLRGAVDLMPSELSGGMSKRASLARSIALDPMMIMYDEPFTGQDPITVGVIMKLIKMLNDNLGLTSIIVSHDVQEVSAISDYIYMVSEGKVVGQGEPAKLAKSGSESVRQFLDGSPDGPVAFQYPSNNLVEDFIGA